jgi:hypothetical protein
VRRALLLMMVVLGIATPGPAIDKVSCLQAKSNFLPCAALWQSEEVPLRSCLAADSGYAACRKIEGMGSHQRCLPAKGQYAYCRELNHSSLTHFECVAADSGFKDCVEYTRNPLVCLNVKGGYGACRKANPELAHLSCVNADAGYADCLKLGENHNVCVGARRSYRHCRENDGHSHLFCTKIGKGYAECRAAGFSLAFCNQADHGFADCAKFREYPLE